MNPPQGLGNDNSPYEHDVSAPNLTVNPTQDWREDFLEKFVEHTVDCGMDNSHGYVLKHKGCFLKDSDWKDIETFIESLIERGRLQGIEEAKGCVPKKEVAQFGRENSWQIEHANGHNDCRNATITALNKLKGE